MDPRPSPAPAPLRAPRSEPGVFAFKNPNLRLLLLGLLLVATIIFAYEPAWHAGFIWDDDEYVTHNQLLTAPDGLRRIWFSTDSPSQYFPLVYTSFRAQHALWGLDPAGYHWVNILLHAVNALLVWRLLSRLAVPGAWLGAAIFALHPLQVESVAWITELKNVQSLFFTLLVFLAWLRFIERTDPARGPPAPEPASPPNSGSSLLAPRSFTWLLLAFALVCHALALFSKTTACTIPAGLVLILWLRRRPLTLARWAQIAPFVLLGLVMGLVSIWWERHQQGTVGDEFSYDALDRVLIAGRALFFYFGKLLWPENLTFSYPLWPIDASDPRAYLWPAACLALAAGVFWLRRHAGRSIETALVFFAATLLPLLGFFMLYTFRYTFVADHYVYVALLGPAALAAAGLALLAPRIRAVHAALPPVLCGLLLLGLSTLTWRQSRMYHDLRTLWETTIARNPASFMGHNNLGAIELAEGRPELAIALFQRALAIKPDHTHALANLGGALLRTGRPAEAVALFRRVLEISPDDAKGHSDLAQVLLQTGSPEPVEPLLRRAVALDPKLAEGHHALGLWLLRAGRPAEAAPSLERAIALYPDYTEAHYHLGLVRLAEERPSAAAECFRRALALSPGHSAAHNNLGTLLYQAGRKDEALDHYRRALALLPDADTHNNLGWALLDLGRPAEAVTVLQDALRLRPDFPAARMNLVQTLLALGRPAEAVATLEAHLALRPDDLEARYNLACLLIETGRPAPAIEPLQTVLAAAPGHIPAHHALTHALLAVGRTSAAISQQERLLALAPDEVSALASLGWLLATTPDPLLRNPARALALARRARELAGADDPMLLRTEAAAEAASGRFPAAAAIAENALRLATETDQPVLRTELATHLAGYRAGRLPSPAPL